MDQFIRQRKEVIRECMEYSDYDSPRPRSLVTRAVRSRKNYEQYNCVQIAYRRVQSR